ncbi:NlpC/P60 family protein [Dichotomicrobium thermohalophilum]|uniref:NlpC/P60 family putative phage cell wall peptidase n=1 Tax=Dichotomicrobium thermohalophilum TaxID=933063 RepID=A0A397Q6T0_9HYPH|nr:NlpC/P60 family protein [Dichotomicrobium thermohalophilum]RIA56758.1 NlpC/P60 family putative phage cell wall peptidase [Dichotomicrobium thermohalophilum]
MTRTVGQRVVAAARGWLGTPYHHQAAVKGAGCDCLGLIRGVYAEVMGREPETPPAYSRDWGEMRSEETLLAAARRHLRELHDGDAILPGDVLIFRIKPGAIAKHAGIVSETTAGEPTRMIHAQEGVGVAEINLSHWWRRKIVAVFRF